jgi:hypothetical protein
MLTSIGRILNGSPTPAGRAPVRRGSHLAGRHEATFWRGTDRQEVRRIILAARRYELAERKRGRRTGPLGHVALEVLELLAHLVSYRTGRLEPSLEYLMRKLRRSKDAVVRALQSLRAHGFLDWLRRYVPTGQEGRGPQVKQTSNAYRLSMPAQAMRLLGRLAHASPVPEDVSHAQEARRAELDAYRASLPLDELPLFEVDDGPLAQVLARLGSLVQERESARQTELKAKMIP